MLSQDLSKIWEGETNMCQGIAIFADNKRALYGKKTNSHSETASQHNVNEDNFRKFEYLWWEKKIVDAHSDRESQQIVAKISYAKALQLVEKLVRKNFGTQVGLAKWLKGVPDEWDKLMEPEFKSLAKKVNPILITFQDKIAKFKKQPIEKYNPYQATKLPSLKKLRSFKKLDQVRDQVWAQVGDQVWDQVRDQVGAQVRDQVWDQVRDQVRDQVGDQVRDQVRDQVGAQVRDQVWAQVRDQVWDQVRDQVGDQVWATSYWAVKLTLGLPVKHWFFDFLKLGVMIVFVKGKAKIFGKKGKYLGEYNESDLK